MSSPTITPSIEIRSLPIEIPKRKIEVDLKKVREILGCTIIHSPHDHITPSPADENDFNRQLIQDKKIVDVYNNSLKEEVNKKNILKDNLRKI